MCRTDNLKAFGATHGSTEDKRLTFSVQTVRWTVAATDKGAIPSQAGWVKGATSFVDAWKKDEENRVDTEQPAETKRPRIA